MEKSKTSSGKWKVEKDLRSDNILNNSCHKIILIVCILSLLSCKTNFNIIYDKPIEDFNIQKVSDAPNYSLKFWAEHPNKIIKHATLPKNYTDSL